jgi:hypothetical protein
LLEKIESKQSDLVPLEDPTWCLLQRESKDDMLVPRGRPCAGCEGVALQDCNFVV